MGSFSRTCAVSALPIEAGDKIRVVLLNENPYGESRWSVRSVPFRAKYNDYGGIEDYDDKGIHAKLTMAQFKRDLIERPWGDNLCHDVPIGPNTPLGDLFSAIGTEEGRVRVRRTESRINPRPKIKVPKGIPTWKRVSKLLTAKGIKDFTTNRVAYGLVRVRPTRYDDRKAVWHDAVIAALEPRYRVEKHYEYGPKYHEDLSAENKDWDVWLLVLPRDEVCEVTESGEFRSLPPIDPRDKIRRDDLLHRIEHRHGERPFRDRTMRVGWAMIREDVWQAMLKLGGGKYDWEKVPTVKSHVERGKKTLQSARDHLKSHYSFLEQIQKLAPDEKVNFGGFGESPEDNIDFLISQEWNLRSLPFVTGLDYAFAHLVVLDNKGEVTPKEVATIIRDLSELFVVQELLYLSCRFWAPTYSGPQSGVWKLHGKALNAFAKIAETIHAEQEAEYAKYR